MISSTAAKSSPFSPTKQELQIAVANWMKGNKPRVLECQVEQYLKDRGHEVLWTPPYCAQLQPIELFWAAGKNHAADHSFNGRIIKLTVMQLREGWYGNEHLWPDEDDPHGCVGTGRMTRRRKRPLNCAGLVRTAEQFMNDKFIKIAGFDGTIDALEGVDSFQPTTTDMPIDMVINITDEEDENSE